MKLLIVLQNTELESITNVEELMLAKAQLGQIDAGYQQVGIDTPAWVIDRLDEVEREINLRVQGELKRRLKEAKARRAGLRTAEEKRNELDATIADLEKRLG